MANVSNMRFSRTDWGIVFIVLALVIIGLVMVYSASYGFALFEGGIYENQPTYFVQRQVVYTLIGLVALLVGWRVDYRLYRKYAVEILVLTVAVLVVMAVLGRWVLSARHSIQPAEMAKLGAMIYIAVWLEAKSKDIQNKDIRHITLGLIPFAILLGVIAGLIVAQPDYSTATLLVVTATAMFFVAGADIKQLLIGFLFGGIALVAVALAVYYRFERVDTWLSGPFEDALGKGYQTVQSVLALVKGGWFGVGLGESEQKFTVFAPHTDCIFAIIGEELGFLGASLVILIYGLWTWRGLRIARYAPDAFGSLLAVGIVGWVTFQAALHIGVITASTPFTGTVLPFVSYGGSSLVSCLASVGILLNISRSSRLPGPRATSWGSEIT
jgi:cell division protein FtsW